MEGRNAAVRRCQESAGTAPVIPPERGGTSLTIGKGVEQLSEAASAYLIDWDQFELRYNRMPGYQENPNLGGGPRGYIDAVCGLVVYNPLGLGKIAPTA